MTSMDHRLFFVSSRFLTDHLPLFISIPMVTSLSTLLIQLPGHCALNYDLRCDLSSMACAEGREGINVMVAQARTGVRLLGQENLALASSTSHPGECRLRPIHGTTTSCLHLWPRPRIP
jgi:hypothetical protein